MKGSKYSNLTTSKLSTKLIDQTCFQHQGESYTNFCSSMTCIKPLCPECIENHYAYHKNIRTAPEIDSFKTLRNKCVAKIGDILEHVGMDQSQTSLSDLQTIFQASLKKVRETRQQCKKISDSYFNNLQDFIKKKMVRITSQQSDLFVEMDKVNNIISELKLLCGKMENARSFLSSAENIIKLDGDKLEEKVKEGCANIVKFKQMHKANLIIQKNFQQKFYNFLTNTFYYGNKQNLQTMPKIVQQMKSKNTIQNISRSRSKSRDQTQQMQVLREGEQREMGFGSGTVYKEKKEREKGSDREDDKHYNLSRKSSQKTLKTTKKQIIGMNTFHINSPRRYLHFFQHDQNILHLLDLEQGDQFQQIQLSLSIKVPDFHKSISVANGDLYLIGGADPDIPQRKSQKIFLFNFSNSTLSLYNNLKYARSSHSVCFNNRYIYILGGYLHNQTLTNRCQRIDIVNNKVDQIRPMLHESCSFACCSFAGRYIYKFGGVGENNQTVLYIERYDEKTGMWEMVNPTVELAKGQSLIPLSTSAAVQITKQQIMVIGGYDRDNTGHTQTYILRVQDNGQCSIRDINLFPLPEAEGFWNNNPIVHKKMVFALQNVSVGQSDCSQSVRRILSFDGASWRAL